MSQHTPQPPDALLKLLQQVKDCYSVQPTTRKRGRPRTYSALSFLLLAVAAVALRTFKERELHRLLSRDAALREAMEFRSVPHRRTIERRMQALIPEAEAQVAALGQEIAREVQPAAEQLRFSAVDGRMYEATGPLWHQKHRREGRIPVGLPNEETGDARLVCRRCGISRPTLRKWWRRFQQHGEQGLRSNSRRPHNFPNSNVTDRHEELILGLRRERKLGPLRIQAELLRLHDLRFSTATIWKVLDRHQAKPLLRRRPSPPKRYSREVPGKRVQVDTRKIAPGIYQYTAVDDCTGLRP